MITSSADINDRLDGTDSQRAYDLAAAHMPSVTGLSTAVVFKTNDLASTAAVIDEIRALPRIDHVDSPTRPSRTGWSRRHLVRGGVVHEDRPTDDRGHSGGDREDRRGASVDAHCRSPSAVIRSSMATCPRPKASVWPQPS